MQHTNRATQTRWQMCESANRKYDVCSQPLKRLLAGFTFFSSSFLFKLMCSSFSSVSSRNSLVSFRHAGHTLISQIRSTCTHTHTHTTTTVRRSLLLFLLFIWRLPVNYYRVASCNIDVSTPRFVVGFCICTSLRNAFYFYYSSSHFSSFMNGKHWKHWKHLNFPHSF